MSAQPSRPSSGRRTDRPWAATSSWASAIPPWPNALLGGGLVPVCPAKRGVHVVHTGVRFLPLLPCGSHLACFPRDGQEDPSGNPGIFLPQVTQLQVRGLPGATGPSAASMLVKLAPF